MKLLAQRPQDAVAAVEKMVDSGWQGFEWAWFDRERGTVGGGRKTEDGGTVGAGTAVEGQRDGDGGRWKPKVGEIV
jgi:hypothetical protein